MVGRFHIHIYLQVNSHRKNQKNLKKLTSFAIETSK
nr:MAG TPA: Putative viral replication protein [Caudoviricetes sp.]